MAFLFRPFGFLAPKHSKSIWLSNILALSVPDFLYLRFQFRFITFEDIICNLSRRDHRGRDRMVVLLQLPVQSVPITTKIHGKMYSIQLYVIKFVFVSDLRQVDGFLRVLRFLQAIKLTATTLLKYC